MYYPGYPVNHNNYPIDYYGEYNRLTPVACAGKWTLIELNNGTIFPMQVQSADPMGQTVGLIAPTMAQISFPSSSIKQSVCF